MSNNIIGLNISGAAKIMQDISVAGKIDLVRRSGLNAIELHPYREWPIEQGGIFGQSGASLREIREMFGGLDAVSVHAPMGDTPSVKDAVKRGDAIDGIRDSLRAASFLGAKVAVVHCRAVYIETVHDEREVARIYRDIGDYAEAFGVKVAVETSTDLESIEKFLRIIEDISHDNVGATVDTGHLLRCLSDEEKSSADVTEIYNGIVMRCTGELLQMDKLFHVHLNDVRQKNFWDHYGMGMGFIDFEGFMGLLRECDYSGMLVLEIHRGESDEVGSLTEDEMQVAVDLVQRLSNKIPATPAGEG